MQFSPISCLSRDGRPYIIRPITGNDAAQAIGFLRAVDQETRFLAREPGEFNLTLEQEQAFLQKQLEAPRTWMATVDMAGEMVGICTACERSNRLRMRHRATLAISVRQSHWRCGIGSALLAAAIDWCRRQGFEQLELEVEDGNIRALALYERFGFVAYGTRPRALKYADGSYGEEIYMVLAL